MTTSEPPVRRTRKAEQRAETIEQIYNAAEELFSKHGLHGVTLKDVARQVGVHHTLLNYYFDDKKTLFDAVFARRAVVTAERRMRALDDYEKSLDGPPTVEGALHAFLDTDLATYDEGGSGWRNYAKLGAQVANTPEWGADLMDRHFDPVVLRLIELLQKALPQCSRDDLFWGYHFVTGCADADAGQDGTYRQAVGWLVSVRRFRGGEGENGEVHGWRVFVHLPDGLARRCSGAGCPVIKPFCWSSSSIDMGRRNWLPGTVKPNAPHGKSAGAGRADVPTEQASQPVPVLQQLAGGDPAGSSHLPFQRRERAMLRFRRTKTLQKFASIHANVHNHFNLERHLVDRKTYRERRSAALAEWQIIAS